MSTKIRDVVFPLIKATKVLKGLSFERLLGTGFLLKDNLGLTSLGVLQDEDIDNIYCMFVINNQWEGRNIKNIVHDKISNISSFSITNCPYQGFINVSAEQHYSSANFMLWGYPDEYLFEINEDRNRPDLAYHQGYIIRRLSSIPNLKEKNLFEINLALSEGCCGSPLILRNNNNWELIGIYEGSRKFIINKSYKELLKFIEKDDGFWEKLKTDKENFSTFDILDRIFENLSSQIPLISLVHNEINRYKNNKLEIETLSKVIQDKDSLKEKLKGIMTLMNEQITINYGLATRITSSQLQILRTPQ